ncbi:hypothetical protein CUU64_13110 [Bacillus sp. V5-8f]|nr:hypothetical protein CUU64_13110 [Bacillus sp. V5-8f]
MQTDRNLTLLIWKMAIGSALSWELASLFGSKHPYLAPLSIILCLQNTVNKTIKLAIRRIIGTVIGVSVSVIIASHMSVHGWTLGLMILIGSYIGKWLTVDKIVLHQVALTILFVFVFEHQTKQYPLDRLRDTAIGVIIAILLQFLLFPRFKSSDSVKIF